jgi:hypothetical protein
MPEFLTRAWAHRNEVSDGRKPDRHGLESVVKEVCSGRRSAMGFVGGIEREDAGRGSEASESGRLFAPHEKICAVEEEVQAC